MQVSCTYKVTICHHLWALLIFFGFNLISKAPTENIAKDKYLEILWLMGPHGYEDNSLKIVYILKELSQDSKSPTSYIVPR